MPFLSKTASPDRYSLLKVNAKEICLREKLVIEVDGGYHEEAAQKEDDQRRTLDLARMGYTVIRFRNEEVANNTDHVIEQIKKQLFNE